MASPPSPSTMTIRSLDSTGQLHKIHPQIDNPIDLSSPALEPIISIGSSQSYAISTVMNQPSSANVTSAAFSALRSSIPSTLKPTALSSLVSLSSSPKQSVLAASHKRSAPPPIKLSESPKISIADFDPYLDQIQNEWARWEKNLNIGSDGTVNLRPADLHALDASPTTCVPPKPVSLSARLRSRAPPPLASVPSVFFDQRFSLADPVTFDIVTERLPSQLAPSSPTNAPTHLPPPKLEPLSIPDLATDQILQEKLSHYLDIVELNLIEEIGLRSSSFFSALGNLQSLHAQTASCMAQVDGLTTELDQLRLTVAQRGLDIIRYGRRRRNIIKIELGLIKVKDVWHSVRQIEEMIQAGEWPTALSLIEGLEGLWNSSELELSSTTHVGDQTSGLDPASLANSAPNPPPVRFRLNKLKALASLPSRLSTFRNTISRAMEAELVSILSHDLKVNIQTFISTNGQGWERAELKSSALSASSEQTDFQNGGAGRSVVKERLKERLRPTFNGLARAGGMDKAVGVWREGVMKEVREIVKTTLSAVSEVDLDDKDDCSDISQSQFSSTRDKRAALSEKTLNLSRNLKALAHPEFLKVAQETFLNLIGCIEIVETQSRALLEMAEQLNSQATDADRFIPASAPLSPGLVPDPGPPEDISELDKLTLVPSIDLENLSLKLTETVQGAAELANVRFAKVIGVRTELHSHLTLQEFFAIFDQSWRFVVRCEVISRRMIVALRGVMVGQAKAFLQSFHQSKITESARIVEQEQWTQVEVPARVQETVNLMIGSAMEDPKVFVLNRDRAGLPEVEAEGSVASVTAKQLEIEGTSFHAVSAVLDTLNTLADYLQVVVNCSLLTTDAMGKIVEFLKAFNSRTCQVVLGAGAIRSAGLKNITAKHLALASQALSTMISLIPYIRECLRRHLNLKQAVMLVDFDKLKRDFQEHQNEIHAKLISIMSDRLAVHSQSLKSVDWEKEEEDADSAKPVGPNGYLESLLKEVSTLHRVLSRYLNPSTLQHIMTQVFSAIHGVLQDEFNRLEPQSERARARLVRDASYFSTKLSDLKASETSQSQAKQLVEHMQCKTIPGEATAAAADPGLASPLADRAENFRSKFRFLSPRRSVIATPTLVPDPPTDVAGPAPDSRLGVAAAAGEAVAGDASTGVPETTGRGSEDKALGPMGDETHLASAPAESAPAPAPDPVSPTALAPSTPAPVPAPREDPPPVAAQPQLPRMSLSQRLAALANNRRVSMPNSPPTKTTTETMATNANDNKVVQKRPQRSLTIGSQDGMERVVKVGGQGAPKDGEGSAKAGESASLGSPSESQPVLSSSDHVAMPAEVALPVVEETAQADAALTATEAAVVLAAPEAGVVPEAPAVAAAAPAAPAAVAPLASSPVAAATPVVPAAGTAPVSPAVAASPQTVAALASPPAATMPASPAVAAPPASPSTAAVLASPAAVAAPASPAVASTPASPPTVAALASPSTTVAPASSTEATAPASPATTAAADSATPSAVAAPTPPKPALPARQTLKDRLAAIAARAATNQGRRGSGEREEAKPAAAAAAVAVAAGMSAGGSPVAQEALEGLPSLPGSPMSPGRNTVMAGQVESAGVGGMVEGTVEKSGTGKSDVEGGGLEKESSMEEKNGMEKGVVEEKIGVELKNEDGGMQKSGGVESEEEEKGVAISGDEIEEEESSFL